MFEKIEKIVNHRWNIHLDFFGIGVGFGILPFYPAFGFIILVLWGLNLYVDRKLI